MQLLHQIGPRVLHNLVHCGLDKYVMCQGHEFIAAILPGLVVAFQ